MSAVDQVFELIEQMSDDERLALEKRLSEKLEAEWSEAVAENRRVAQARGITEASIDRVLHRRRYGE